MSGLEGERIGMLAGLLVGGAAGRRGLRGGGLGRDLQGQRARRRAAKRKRCIGDQSLRTSRRDRTRQRRPGRRHDRIRHLRHDRDRRLPAAADRRSGDDRRDDRARVTPAPRSSKSTAPKQETRGRSRASKSSAGPDHRRGPGDRRLLRRRHLRRSRRTRPGLRRLPRHRPDRNRSAPRTTSGSRSAGKAAARRSAPNCPGGEGNLISGNEYFGIVDSGQGTEVAANRIGLDAPGGPLGNGGYEEDRRAGRRRHLHHRRSA